MIASDLHVMAAKSQQRPGKQYSSLKQLKKKKKKKKK